MLASRDVTKRASPKATSVLEPGGRWTDVRDRAAAECCGSVLILQCHAPQLAGGSPVLGEMSLASANAGEVRDFIVGRCRAGVVHQLSKQKKMSLSARCRTFDGTKTRLSKTRQGALT